MLPPYSVGFSTFGGKPGAIAGGTTIHSEDNDNCFLGCVRLKNPGVGAHDSTAEAVKNLLKYLDKGEKVAHIVGHGNTGLIVTGTSNGISDPNKSIKLENYDIWKPHLMQLKGKVSSLTLWACHTGAGERGAKLLYRIAKVIGAPVTAPAGLIWCGDRPDLYLINGVRWQTATPTYSPSWIEPPD